MRGIEQIPWLYDALSSILDLCGFDRWRRALAAGAEGRILEVGCGTGRNFALYRTGARVVGLEPDRAALVLARRRAPGAPLVVGRVEALPFRAGAFDTVVSSLVFCSVGEPLAGLVELHRVLGPSGELRMLEHVRDERPVWARLQDRVQPLWTAVTGGCHPNRETERLVAHAGFRILETGRLGRRVLRLFRAEPR
jgi:ubiquinone/menaquinone biosynthesis C-methylase UbiE